MQFDGEFEKGEAMINIISENAKRKRSGILKKAMSISPGYGRTGLVSMEDIEVAHAYLSGLLTARQYSHAYGRLSNPQVMAFSILRSACLSGVIRIDLKERKERAKR